MRFIISLVSFMVVITTIVFVHELGHYLVARWRGMTIDTFSIGFGPTLYSYTDRRGTIWKFGLFLAGGYVMIAESERNIVEARRRGTEPLTNKVFESKSLLDRSLVTAAGPLINFLFTIILLFGLMVWHGQPTDEPIIGTVYANGPAERAGLEANDRIVSIDGESIATFDQLIKVIFAHPGQKVTVTVDRDGLQQSLPLTIGTREINGQTYGVINVTRLFRDISVSDAAEKSITGTGKLMYRMVVDFRPSEVGGPVGLATISGEAASFGIPSLIMLLALLSTNIGLVNLVPFGNVTDGGKLLFCLIEGIRGRKLSERVEFFLSSASMALLGVIFVYAIYNDVRNLF